MGVKSNYGRFSDGVQFAGVSMQVHQKGKVFYVCNAGVVAPTGIAGSDGNKGNTPEHPFATIAHAFSVAVAGRGDKIVILPGHAETVSAASGITLNVAGVDIIGVGQGAQRPTITLGTANTATVGVTANDISITNVLCVANFLNIATCFALTTAKNFKLQNVDLRDTSAILNFVKAVQTDSTDNHADGLTLLECTYNGLGTSATTSLVNAQGKVDRLTVEDCNVNIQGTTATTGALVLATSKALTTASIKRNNVNSPITTSSAGALIVAGTGGSGVVRDNYVNTPAASTAIMSTTGTGLGFVNNYISRSAADTSGLLLPAVST